MNEAARDDVLRRIQALMNMTIENGCTPAEAERAALKAEELLQKYQLSVFDVQAKTFDEEVVHEDVRVDAQVWPTWMVDLGHYLARGYDCECILCKRWDAVKEKPYRLISIIGVESDAKVARYMFDTLQGPLYKLATEAGKGDGATRAALVRYRNSFILAAAIQICNRLQRQRKKSVEAGPATVGALVEVKGAMVEQFMAKHHPKLGVHSSSQQHDDLALVRGEKAGKEIELRQGLAGPGESIQGGELPALTHTKESE
jgi:hypothetical protein